MRKASLLLTSWHGVSLAGPTATHWQVAIPPAAHNAGVSALSTVCPAPSHARTHARTHAFARERTSSLTPSSMPRGDTPNEGTLTRKPFFSSHAARFPMSRMERCRSGRYSCLVQSRVRRKSEFNSELAFWRNARGPPVMHAGPHRARYPPVCWCHVMY